MPDDRRRPPRPPDPPDDELRESLELLATVAASVSDRVEGQSAALDRMAKVLAETRSAAFAARNHTDPAHTAEQVATQVRAHVLPTARSLAETALDLTRGAAAASKVIHEVHALRQDMASLKAHEDREAVRWRRRLMLWGPSALLVVMLLTAIAAPRLLAAHEGLCEIVGTTWSEGSTISDGRRSSCWFDAWW